MIDLVALAECVEEEAAYAAASTNSDPRWRTQREQEQVCRDMVHAVNCVTVAAALRSIAANQVGVETGTQTPISPSH